ncbi:MAG: response regulator [Thermoleophilia bacterium]|nr:response regulator [Thermoleophilia bacterium]
MEPHAAGAIVVADDDSAVRLLCRVNLELEGYRVVEAADARELEDVVGRDDVAGVFLDIRLGEADGVALARRMRKERPGLRVVFLSGSVERADSLGELAEGFLAKPFSLEALSESARQLAPPPA